MECLRIGLLKFQLSLKSAFLWSLINVLHYDYQFCQHLHPSTIGFYKTWFTECSSCSCNKWRENMDAVPSGLGSLVKQLHTSDIPPLPSKKLSCLYSTEYGNSLSQVGSCVAIVVNGRSLQLLLSSLVMHLFIGRYDFRRMDAPKLRKPSPPPPYPIGQLSEEHFQRETINSNAYE